MLKVRFTGVTGLEGPTTARCRRRPWLGPRPTGDRLAYGIELQREPLRPGIRPVVESAAIRLALGGLLGGRVWMRQSALSMRAT